MIGALHSIGFTNAMITSSFITIFICVVAIIAGRNLKMVPDGIQNMIEMGLEKLYNFFQSLMGPDLCKKYFPLVGTLFIYILICNYSGLIPMMGEAPGMQAPTTSLNFPAGLAIVVFFALQFIGIKEHHGIKAYARLLKPIAFVFPLMIIDDFAKPLSLTFRLYGNTFGDETAVGVFREICPIGLPIVMQFLVVLVALIQALVFALLTAIYITEVCEMEHDEERLPDPDENGMIEAPETIEASSEEELVLN